MQPIRLQLSRKKGFDLQELSRAANGLPARAVTRPSLFGNVFRVTEATPPESAVRAFRGYLKTWSDKKIIDGVRDAGTLDWEPMAGLGMLVHRNRIRANLHRLRGFNLACACAPGAPCHADVYLALLATDWPERWLAKYPRINEAWR